MGAVWPPGPVLVALLVLAVLGVGTVASMAGWRRSAPPPSDPNSANTVGIMGRSDGTATSDSTMWVGDREELGMAAMKPRTGDGPLEVTKEGRGVVMRVPLEGGGRLVVEMSVEEAAELAEQLGTVSA